MMTSTPAPTSITVAQAPTRRRDGSPRTAAAVLLATCAAPLVVAVFLRADPSGVGTHTQLGLAGCGFLQATGYPCLSCGMTTAVTLAVHGHLVQSWWTQPAGAAIALLCAAGVLLGGWGVVTGASLAPIGRRLGSWPVLVLGVAGLLAAWVYKIMVM